MPLAETNFFDWVKLVGSVLGIFGTLLVALFWVLRAEVRAEIQPSLQRLTTSTDHLAKAIDTASTALAHAAERLENHETRIAVLEDRQPVSRRRPRE